MTPGFYITKLVCDGLNMPLATLEFSKGANLITGASDTGKSYAFSIINYVLGRSKEPKDIPESIGYTDFYLEIETFSDEKVYTLRRTKGKDRIVVKECFQKVFLTYNSKSETYKVSGSSADEKNISDFLLMICDLSAKKLLSSKTKGTTQKLSFKNINQLTSIPEDRIITEESPFYPSSQVISRTPEQALLRLLLTKEDFSDVLEKESKEKRESSINGKLEYIAAQLSNVVSKRENTIKDIEKASYKSIDSKFILELQTRLKENVDGSKEILKRKSRLTNIKQHHIDRISYTNELLSRFTILNRQYASDKKRLEFVLEAENLSSQLGNVVCPICTSPLDKMHIEHLNELENFKIAITEELRKIDMKMFDLAKSILQLKEQAEKSRNLLTRTNDELYKLEHELQDNLTPSITELQTNLSSYLDLENKKTQISLMDDQIKSLYASKDRLEQLLKQKIENDEITIIEYSNLSELAEFIKARLTNWNYEPQVNIVFDSAFTTFDIVISGKSRRSYGKGKRAISYTACLLGLMDYCQLNRVPFSNLIILDSPLTTFEEKKRQPTIEAVTSTVLDSFFSDLANISLDCQVIIFDNKIPKAEIKGINVQIFTGDESTGRPGFFVS